MSDYTDGLFADLQDPGFAVAYVHAALEDDAPEVFLLHLREVAEAWGGRGKRATDTQLAREALSRMCRTQGNPLEIVGHADDLLPQRGLAPRDQERHPGQPLLRCGNPGRVPGGRPHVESFASFSADT